MAGRADTYLELAEDDRQNMREVLYLYYDKRVVDGWTMNTYVAEVLQDLVENTLDCSNVLAFVPQPKDALGAKGLSDFVKRIVRNIAKRVGQQRRQGEDRKGDIKCKRAVAWQYRSAFDMASMGVR